MPAHAHTQSASPSPRYPPPQLLLLPAPVAARATRIGFSHSPARSSASNSGGSSPGRSANGDHVIREEDFYAPPRSPSASPPRRKASPFTAQLQQQQQHISAPLSRASSPDYVSVTLTAEGLATRPTVSAAGWGGIAGGLGGSTARTAAAASLHTPRGPASYATFAPTPAPAPTAPCSSDQDGSAEEALALYAYRQTRKILLLTICVGLCSGARIASSLIELHYTWLQVHQDAADPDAQNTSAFPEQWFIFVDGLAAILRAQS